MHWALIVLITLLCICSAVLMFAMLVIVPSLSGPEPSDDVIQKSKTVAASSVNTDIVVTMTTLPHRVDTVLPLTLHTLRVQTMMPASVEINLPHTTKSGEPYVIPSWLQEEHDAGRVTVYRVDDVGPATKYIPTLQRYRNNPDRRILVVDDDMLLHPKRVEEFDAASKRFPNDALTAHGMMIDNGKINFISFVQSFNDWKMAVMPKARCTTEEPIDIITGYQNYLIRPRFFDMRKLTDYDAMPKEAFWVDDVVISGHLAQQGVTRRVPKDISGSNMLPSSHFWQHVSGFVSIKGDSQNLSTGPNASDHNNNVMIDYFKDFW